MSSRGASPSPRAISFIFGARFCENSRLRRAPRQRPWCHRAGVQLRSADGHYRCPGQSPAVHHVIYGPEKNSPLRGGCFVKESLNSFIIEPAVLCAFPSLHFLYSESVFLFSLNLNTFSRIYKFTTEIVLLINAHFKSDLTRSNCIRFIVASSK